MTVFVVEFKMPGELGGGRILPSLNALESETLPLAVRAVQKAVDDGAADEAVVYVPVRIVRAARRVEIVDVATQRAVAVDTPAPNPDREPPVLLERVAATDPLAQA